MSSPPPVETLPAAAQRARATPFDLAAILRALPADVSEADAAALAAWPVPALSPDGGCSLGRLAAEPFSVLDELVARGAARGAALRRLWALRRVCAALAATTGAEWVGVYEVVPPSARAAAAGGAADASNLLKLAYVGAPSRPLFPLTAAFAEGSNNAAVARSGAAVVYHDVRALPRDAPYYVCDGKVRAEACVPIVDALGAVVGLLDAEAFAPGAFAAPAMLGAVLGAAAALGAADLLRGPLSAADAWQAGVTDVQIAAARDDFAADFEAAARAEPLVGAAEEPVAALAAAYEGNAAFLPKLADLAARYASVRRVRGDGSCFYRALLFAVARALVLACVRAPAAGGGGGGGGGGGAPLQAFYEALLAHVAGGAAALAATGGAFEKATTCDFFDALGAYLRGLAGGAGGAADVEARAAAPLRDESAGGASPAFFATYAVRLLVALEVLGGGGAAYADLVLAASGLPLADWVSAEVTLASVEADYIHVIAAARALRVVVRVAQVDASTKGDAVAVNELPDDGKPVELTVDLLYRPGHYDVLTRK